MQVELTDDDIAFILESLRYTKLKFESYEGYPSKEFQRGRVVDVEEVIAKVRALRDGNGD